jgi:hypothetical protein
MCEAYTAGYLSHCIYAIGLHPNSRTAGYLGVCICKNPAIACLAVAGFSSVYIRTHCILYAYAYMSIITQINSSMNAIDTIRVIGSPKLVLRSLKQCGHLVAMGWTRSQQCGHSK